MIEKIRFDDTFGASDRTTIYLNQWEIGRKINEIIDHLNQSEKKHTRENCCYVEGCSVCQPSEPKQTTQKEYDEIGDAMGSSGKDEPSEPKSFLEYAKEKNVCVCGTNDCASCSKCLAKEKEAEKHCTFCDENHPDGSCRPCSDCHCHTYIPPKGSTEDRNDVN